MGDQKKKVYVDQMIYSYLLNDTNIFGFQIEELSNKLNNHKLLLSIANCYELSPLTRSHTRIIESLKSCEKLYLPMAFHLQYEQLTQYIFERYFEHKYNPLLECRFISQIFTFLKPTPIKIPIGDNLSDFIKLFSTRYLRTIKNVTEEDWLKSANKLISNKDRILTEEFEQALFERRFKKFLSQFRDPNGNLINTELRKKIMADLKKEIKNDYKKWSTLFIEYLFFKYRYLESNQKPEKNDARDIEHIICGLCNSDFFITCDNNLLGFCDYAKDKFDKMPIYGKKFDILQSHM